MANEHGHRSAPCGPRGAKATALCPYNNGVSLHVGPVRVLGGHAEAEISGLYVKSGGARSTAPVADAADFTPSLRAGAQRAHCRFLGQPLRHSLGHPVPSSKVEPNTKMPQQRLGGARRSRPGTSSGENSKFLLEELITH